MPESYWKRPVDESGEVASGDSGSSKLGWTIALIAIVTILSTRCERTARELMRDLISSRQSDIIVPMPAPAPAATQPAPEPVHAVTDEMPIPEPEAELPASLDVNR